MLSRRELTFGSASAVAGNDNMSNARVVFESDVGEFSISRARTSKDVLVVRDGMEGVNSRWVLEPNRNPWTLVVIIHEEAVNQFLGMAYLEEYLAVEK